MAFVGWFDRVSLSQRQPSQTRFHLTDPREEKAQPLAETKPKWFWSKNNRRRNERKRRPNRDDRRGHPRVYRTREEVAAEAAIEPEEPEIFTEDDALIASWLYEQAINGKSGIPVRVEIKALAASDAFRKGQSSRARGKWKEAAAMLEKNKG